MPNPLIGSRPLNIGKRADDRPHAIPPRPEAYVGDNNPYRGTEQHGVSSGASDVLPDEMWEDTTSGVFEPEPEHVEPVKVEIVTRYGRELRRFNPTRDTLQAGVARMIIGRNPYRSSMTINNIGTGTLYIGNNESVATYTGFPVAAGGVLNLNTEDAVWALSVAGGDVALIEEFSVKE